MFINSALYNKFMQVECSVCGEHETMIFSAIRPEQYDSNEDDFLIIEYESTVENSFISRLKMLNIYRKFNKEFQDQEFPFIELNLTKYQIEDIRDVLLDVITDFDFIEFEEKFDTYLDRLKNTQFRKLELSDVEQLYQVFKSSDGLQLLIEENPDFYFDPIRLAFSLNDHTFISKEDRKKSIKRYLFHKGWKSPFDRAYFSLTWDETIQFIAATTFMLNDNNIDLFRIEEEDDDEGMGSEA